MTLDDESQERIRDLLNACTELVKAFAEQAADALEKLSDAIRQAAGIVVDLIPDIVDTVQEQTKTRPPRAPVRCIGCRPVTKSRQTLPRLWKYRGLGHDDLAQWPMHLPELLPAQESRRKNIRNGGKTMTPKEYLLQYRDAVRRATAAQDHLDELRAMAERITPNYGGSGGGTHQTGDKLGAAVAKIVDAETKVDSEIELLISTEREIERAIDSVEDERLRNILYRRYICGDKWEVIAVALNIEYRWLLRLHGRALQEVQKKIDH